MYFFFSAVLSLFILPTDTVAPVALPEIIIATSPKEYLHMEKQPAMVSSFSLEDMESKRIHEAKDFSLLTPNLYLPDYGSKMTSSIYIRGIGARMDQPALGLYVDNVPVMNKNNYDFDFFDIRQISILRGPQGTLYGRNAIGGVINVHTLSPFGYQGTRIAAEYGNANTIRYRMATYQLPQEDFGYSLAVNHAQSDGFFTNQYNDEKADRIRNDGLRFRVQKQWNNWQLDNIVSFNSVQQNGFAYSLYDEKTNYVHPINHNDPCLYNRMGISNGTTFQYRNNTVQFSSATSLQYTDDTMTLDQDFLPKSMFTLTQAQTEKAVTQECILKSNPGNAWEWLSG
ncbi:MAG: TonB-dependent receptor plug domain-containing protein, partial [Candidatus Symbiothrix sp.]|nr:TonB-dependent receptor plug domain-containing protein [Candidatus Symbiothrix sp.]